MDPAQNPKSPHPDLISAEDVLGWMRLARDAFAHTTRHHQIGPATLSEALVFATCAVVPEVTRATCSLPVTSPMGPHAGSTTITRPLVHYQGCLFDQAGVVSLEELQVDMRRFTEDMLAQTPHSNVERDPVEYGPLQCQLHTKPPQVSPGTLAAVLAQHITRARRAHLQAARLDQASAQAAAQPLSRRI